MRPPFRPYLERTFFPSLFSLYHYLAGSYALFSPWYGHKRPQLLSLIPQPENFQTQKNWFLKKVTLEDLMGPVKGTAKQKWRRFMTEKLLLSPEAIKKIRGKKMKDVFAAMKGKEKDKFRALLQVEGNSPFGPLVETIRRRILAKAPLLVFKGIFANYLKKAGLKKGQVLGISLDKTFLGREQKKKLLLLKKIGKVAGVAVRFSVPSPITPFNPERKDYFNKLCEFYDLASATHIPQRMENPEGEDFPMPLLEKFRNKLVLDRGQFQEGSFGIPSPSNRVVQEEVHLEDYLLLLHILHDCGFPVLMGPSVEGPPAPPPLPESVQVSEIWPDVLIPSKD